MDLKIFASTFLLVFLAELGDKTQLSIIALSAKEKTPLTIFLSATLALVTATLIAVIVGTVGAKYLPINIVEKIAALAFIVIGVLVFFNKI
jgi:putative Ca2+/H+ antiporter (TMEM165/GDT1 family)